MGVNEEIFEAKIINYARPLSFLLQKFLTPFSPIIPHLFNYLLSFSFFYILISIFLSLFSLSVCLFVFLFHLCYLGPSLATLVVFPVRALRPFKQSPPTKMTDNRVSQIQPLETKPIISLSHLPNNYESNKRSAARLITIKFIKAII